MRQLLAAKKHKPSACSGRSRLPGMAYWICPHHNFAVAFPEKAKLWDNIKNKGVLPSQCSPRTRKRFFFICDVCAHSFEQALDSASAGCPFCSSQQLCKDDDCQTCWEKSFASSEKATFWSENNECEARHVFKCSRASYYFNCNICKHIFPQALHAIARGKWCGYCASDKLCDDDKCEFCWKKSFASSKQSVFWSKLNKCRPRGVFLKTNAKYLFDCESCNHVFAASPNNIVNGMWCGYCGGKLLCGKSECKFCYEKSLASHPAAQNWSVKNKDLTPSLVFKSSGLKFWFFCDECKESFFTRVISITGLGTWCPLCHRKTEKKLLNWLNTHYPQASVEYQKKFEWCKADSGRFRVFDFLFNEHIIIELDGPQHFVQIHNWEAAESTQKYDVIKQDLATKNGKIVIRLLQVEVLHDLFDWDKILSSVIATLNADLGTPRIIYVARNRKVDDLGEYRKLGVDCKVTKKRKSDQLE